MLTRVALLLFVDRCHAQICIKKERAKQYKCSRYSNAFLCWYYCPQWCPKSGWLWLCCFVWCTWSLRTCEDDTTPSMSSKLCIPATPSSFLSFTRASLLGNGLLLWLCFLFSIYLLRLELSYSNWKHSFLLEIIWKYCAHNRDCESGKSLSQKAHPRLNSLNINWFPARDVLFLGLLRFQNLYLSRKRVGNVVLIESSFDKRGGIAGSRGRELRFDVIHIARQLVGSPLWIPKVLCFGSCMK